MKAVIKCLNNIMDAIPNLNKEYEIYVSESGYPVIDVLDTEIPLFGMKNQEFQMVYKVPKELMSILTPDDNKFFRFNITIVLSSEAIDYVVKVMNKKRKEIAKKEEQERLEKKRKLTEALAAGKARKKEEEESVEEINEESL